MVPRFELTSDDESAEQSGIDSCTSEIGFAGKGVPAAGKNTIRVFL